MSIYENRKIGFPYSVLGFPDMQKMDIVTTKHSKSKELLEAEVNITLMCALVVIIKYILFLKRMAQTKLY